MSAVLRCYVDDETLKWLEKASIETGRAIDELAEAAISQAAIEYKVSHLGYGKPTVALSRPHLSTPTGEKS